MQKWEYLYISIGTYEKHVEYPNGTKDKIKIDKNTTIAKLLTDYGNEGWEVISISQAVGGHLITNANVSCVLKRPRE